MDQASPSARTLKSCRADVTQFDLCHTLRLIHQVRVFESLSGSSDSRDPDRSCFASLTQTHLNPSGWNSSTGLDGWRETSWFASPKKGRPGFRPGDLVFVCAKDTHDCYAVVEVTADPEFQPDDYADWTAANRADAFDRWPWITRTAPRMVPDELLQLKLTELGVRGQGLQNGHVRLRFDQFTAGVRTLARLASG